MPTAKERKQQVIKFMKPPLTNNEVEYLAVILALIQLKDHDLLIHSDSQLIVGHLQQQWKINFEHLKKLNKQVRSYCKNRDIVFHWIPRSQNKAGILLEDYKRQDTIMSNVTLILA